MLCSAPITFSPFPVVKCAHIPTRRVRPQKVKQGSPSPGGKQTQSNPKNHTHQERYDRQTSAVFAVMQQHLDLLWITGKKESDNGFREGNSWCLLSAPRSHLTSVLYISVGAPPPPNRLHQPTLSGAPSTCPAPERK